MVGSVPEDTYAATQGLLDQEDQYAATGPQLMSQDSWVPPNYLEKGRQNDNREDCFMFKKTLRKIVERLIMIEKIVLLTRH